METRFEEAHSTSQRLYARGTVSTDVISENIFHDQMTLCLWYCFYVDLVVFELDPIFELRNP
jgi:hypothetical protein